MCCFGQGGLLLQSGGCADQQTYRFDCAVEIHTHIVCGLLDKMSHQVACYLSLHYKQYLSQWAEDVMNPLSLDTQHVQCLK